MHGGSLIRVIHGPYFACDLLPEKATNLGEKAPKVIRQNAPPGRPGKRKIVRDFDDESERIEPVNEVKNAPPPGRLGS
jgi:hypothetical protein